MSASPGHRKWPDHKVEEHRIENETTLTARDDVVARSTDVIRVDEDGHQPRFYFPRDDVKMARLKRSGKTTECPFKGIGYYLDLRTGDETIPEAAWSYDEPYDEHQALKDRIAFHTEKPALALD